MSKLATESLLIALFPAFSYLLVFSFECGYLYYWKMPTEYIRINLSTIFLGFLGFVTYIFMHILLICLLTAFLADKPLFSWAIVFGTPILTCALAAVLFHCQFKEWLWYGASLSVFLILVITTLTLIGTGVVDSRSFETTFISPFSALLISDMIICIYVLYLAFISTFACFTIGRFRAKNRLEYLIYDDKPGEVVLRQYGSILICGEISADSGLTGKFVTYSIEDKSNKKFSWQKIGPLQRNHRQPIPATPRRREDQPG